MSYYKIGFHTGPGGNRNGIGDYWRALDAAGIPASHISVDDYGPCYDLEQLAKASGVDHNNIFRISVAIPGFNGDVPIYDLDPDEAGEIYWETLYMNLPPEFLEGDARYRVKIAIFNEVDKNRADWLGRCALYIANKANDVGVSVVLFGWSTGEPEDEHWTEPGMAECLRYCASNPRMAGIMLHEYSLTMDLQDGIGYLIGRFKWLESACHELGIRAVDTYITEFGWTYKDLPSPDEAIRQMAPIADLYASAPQVRGAMIWYLGAGFNIENQTQRLIAPVTQAALAYGYTTPSPTPPPPTPPPPPNLPPPGASIDLKDYFSPPAGEEHGLIYTLENNWGQGPERVHLSVSPTGAPNHKYVSKNGKWERRYIGDFWIYLQADTSRSEQEFYTVKGDAWLPRFMALGQSYTRHETVDVYEFDGCRHVASYGFSSDIKMLGYDSVFSSLLDTPVVKLVWLINGVPEEYYWYAKYVGLVGWENRAGKKSVITEFVPLHEQPNKIEWYCSVLNEEVPTLKPPPPTSPPPPPPSNEDLHKLVWELTEEMQESGNGGIQLNADAGLQKEMNKHNLAGLNLQKVTDEISINGKVFMAAQSLTDSAPRRVYVWEPGKPTYFFEDPDE